MVTTMPRSLALLPHAGRWRVAQWAALVATLLLIAGLLTFPEPTLAVLWYLLIPLVPASLLVSPAIWRNICPLATLNLLSNRVAGSRVLTTSLLPAATIGGIVLLVALVPGRRIVFNADGAALGATIIAVALLALVAGAFFRLKAGFCNSICPVLPVERLYGQRPLVAVTNQRCTPCSLCTAKGCLDLQPEKSSLIALGPAATSDRWLRKPYGIFAATFPGFVLGYFMTADGPLDRGGVVYATVLAWMVVSYLVTALLVWSCRITAVQALVYSAAAAAGLYYWFAMPSIMATWGVESATDWLRVAAVALVWAWLAHADPAPPPRAVAVRIG
jgi:hypothetical protein